MSYDKGAGIDILCRGRVIQTFNDQTASLL